MTAFLIFYAFKDGVQKYKIQHPWTNDFSRENYLRRYINVAPLERVRAQIHRKGILLMPLPVDPVTFPREDEDHEAWMKACQNGKFRNPILREVFNPWTLS
jgi:hypothetical protein